MQTGVERRPCPLSEADPCLPLLDEMGPVGVELALYVVVVIGAELCSTSECFKEARILTTECGKEATDTSTGVTWSMIRRVVEGLKPMGRAVGQNLGAAMVQQGPDQWWPCWCKRPFSSPFGPGYQGAHAP